MGEALAHTASSLTRWLDKPVTALLGSDVLLTCSFPAAPCGAGEGDGQRRVTWYFQGQALMELDGIAVTTRKGAESLPLGCPGATLRSSCPASRWPSRAPTAAPCATGGSAERAASANGWQVESRPGLAPCSRPGPEEQHGLLEPGLRILLWTLRGALLLAMALGGWSCYCSGRRRGQVREWIWIPHRWRSVWGAARGNGRGTGGAVPAERLEKGIPVSTAHGAACASRLALTGGPRLNC
ncbi:uncharacterized protein LOC141988406 [Natator depressus]|uniref:uncharacterized protein LOC141988406 n=1 Tax=Natator depressus TaxID=27790 RepID=UPI003D4EF238